MCLVCHYDSVTQRSAHSFSLVKSLVPSNVYLIQKLLLNIVYDYRIPCPIELIGNYLLLNTKKPGGPVVIIKLSKDLLIVVVCKFLVP